MRRFLILAALLLPAAVFAQPADRTLRINQYSTALGGFTARDIVPPGSSAPGILYLNPTTGLPEYLTAGSGITFGSGTISASGGGSVACASITDATTAGCNVLTAANAAAARSAIGAGTSSFDGIFSSLASKPTTLSGYGITDAYPLTGNPSGFLTGITGSQVVAALGYTPGSGTVTSVTAGAGLSGGTITTSGAISLPNTGTAGTYSGVTTDAQGRVTAGTTISINDSPGRSMVTTTSSTGFQISSTRPARVCYEGTFSTTSTIGGPAAVTVFLETADTNSTTPGDWTIRARQQNSNTITLAVALNQVDIEPWSICRDIQAGKFVRIRWGSVTGTASAAINTEQQETLL